MPRNSAPTLRHLYLAWVEDQIEDYKDSVSRSDLLRLAEEVCEELRVSNSGQYQLTEILLAAAVDRKIFKLLRLPGYRNWCSSRSFQGRPILPEGTPAVERSEILVAERTEIVLASPEEVLLAEPK